MDLASPGLRVAVMQPYLFPYAGYYRLFAAVDQFVILDCVQFPRRGRVHRCEVPGPSGQIEWLTIPLARHPRDVLIRDLSFAASAALEFNHRLFRHRWIAEAKGDHLRSLMNVLRIDVEQAVVDYLAAQLVLICEILRLECQFIRSSDLTISPDLRGEDRIIAIARHVGATMYVNSPGGRGLYNSAKFEANGLQLAFLAPWQGCHQSILPALLSGECRAIIKELRGLVLAQSRLELLD